MEVGESIQVESHFDGTQGRDFGGQLHGDGAGALHLTLKWDDSFRIDIKIQVDLFCGQCADTFGQNADFFNGGEGSDEMYSHQILFDFPAEIDIFGVSYGQSGVSFLFRDFIDSLSREVGDFDERQIHGNGKVAGGLFHGTSYFKRLGVVGVADQVDGGLCHVSGVQFTFNFDVFQSVVKFVFHLDSHGADTGAIAHEWSSEFGLLFQELVDNAESLGTEVKFGLDLLLVFGTFVDTFKAHFDTIVGYFGLYFPNFGVFGQSGHHAFQSTAHLTSEGNSVGIKVFQVSFDVSSFVSYFRSECQNVLDGQFSLEGSCGQFKQSWQINGLLGEHGHIHDTSGFNVGPAFDFNLGSALEYHICFIGQSQHFFEVGQIGVAGIASFQAEWGFSINLNDEFSSSFDVFQR